MGTGFGMVGLARYLRGAGNDAADPLAPKAPHFPARAKHVIFLFLNGGPSQVDTFDPKPMLHEVQRPAHARRQPEERAQDRQPARLALRLPPCGKSGIEISEIFPKLGDCDRRRLRDSLDVHGDSQS